MTLLRREAWRLIADDPELDRRFRLTLTTTVIAKTSALQILGELAVLPDMLDARQLVTFSERDPRLLKSGKSVEKRPRISRGGSRHLRRALYMPALVALRRDPYLRGFYQNLLARGKARLQAVVAVMRKLLHALLAMLRSNQPYDGCKLCAVHLAVKAVAACARATRKRERVLGTSPLLMSKSFLSRIYNHRVPAPFSRAPGLVSAPPESTRAWEPTLLWNQFHSQPAF